ncbi:MAG: biopolymer transporter ExbD [Candidatus Symbiothrix sp.]|jgi:biopolymer transport protein ExbD|nr:biopolymer transporter ExbD [Candidatus Symbiothrix sp.]
MSEVQVKESGGGGKNKQKKQTLRVDFTPMVDMNMLLITFFMFCTTLLKPQTMNINMPSNEKSDTEDGSDVKASGAITLLLAGDDQLYYYEGMPKDEKTGEDHYDDPNFLHVSSYDPNGIEEYLIKRNVGTYEQIQELKVQLQNQEIPDSIFRQKSKEIYDKAKEGSRTPPTVMIKPTDFSSYKNLVDVLDEMLVTNIGAYAVIDITDGDRYLLYKKTNDGKYLTPEQVAQGK